jgi:hypothetical protein
VEVFAPDEKDTSMVLLPDSYQVTKLVEAVCLIFKSSDSHLEAKPGDIFVIEGYMLKNVELGSETVHLILENYVLGTYGE